MNISFIVIGRNEGAFLQRCIGSIYKAIKINHLNAEVLYVDSQSTDDSVQVAKSFSTCRVFSIVGKYNSAIARNIGVKEAFADNLIFIDGDMELVPGFLPKIIDRNGNLKYKFVSGNFINQYYSLDGSPIGEGYYQKVYCEEDAFQPTTGGLFAIKRKYWEEVNGMNPIFKKGQDLDFGYRLAAKGILLLRKKEVMAYHNTVDYDNLGRKWTRLFGGENIYPRAILYRKNWNNLYVIRRMLTSDPTVFLFLFSLTLSIALEVPHYLFIYVIGLVLALLYKLRTANIRLLVNHILIQALRDIQTVVAFVFIHPSKKIDYDYKEV